LVGDFFSELLVTAHQCDIVRVCRHRQAHLQQMLDLVLTDLHLRLLLPFCRKRNMH